MDYTQQPSLNTISIGPGILGIERGLERIARLRIVAYVEVEAAIIWNLVQGMEKGILAPAPIWSDAKTCNYEIFRGLVDILLAGYSCQPFSSAGKYYLPFYMGAKFTMKNRRTNELVSEMYFGIDALRASLYADWHPDKITPILLLRSLSSMTHSEKVDLFDYVWPDHKVKDDLYSIMWINGYLEFTSRLTLDKASKFLNWCRSHSFDVDGLIELGIAKEKKI